MCECVHVGDDATHMRRTQVALVRKQVMQEMEAKLGALASQQASREAASAARLDDMAARFERNEAVIQHVALQEAASAALAAEVRAVEAYIAAHQQVADYRNYMQVCARGGRGAPFNPQKCSQHNVCRAN